MAAPLAGIRVVEVANWLAAPSAAALMADLGADVIKVEPPTGDQWRWTTIQLDLGHNYLFELDNRGKRSLALALDQPGAPELLRRLVASADIFVTNLIQPRRERFGLTVEDLQAVKPSLIYVSFTGYGSEGPDADRPGFDYTAFWARSGVWGLMGDVGDSPAACRPGQGDHTTALNLLASTLVALRLRDQTGEGQTVEVTLQRTGMWTIGSDLSQALVSREQPLRLNRREPPNALANSYETRDGDWLMLMMPAPVKYWRGFCGMLGQAEWADDPRYATLEARTERSLELTAQVRALFLQDDAASWGRRLDGAGMIWAPMSDLPSVMEDPQARLMGAFETVQHPDPAVGAFETLSAPFRIAGADIAVRGPAPAVGEHTQAVLEELGVSADEMADLAANGVFG